MKQTNTSTLTYDRILRYFTALCFGFIILFGFYGCFVSPKLRFFYENARVYDEDWTREKPDGSIDVFQMPINMALEDGETVVISTVLPADVEDGMYLSIHTGKSFVACVEEKEIYSFDNKMSRLPGKITKTVIIPIPMKEEYAGKSLTLTVTNGKYGRNSINTAYIGTLRGIELILIKNYALQLAMALLLVIASLITIGIFVYIERRDNRKAPLIFLAEGILTISLWIICDSPLFQLIFRSYFYDGVVSFMLVITMGMPFLLYFDSISDYRKHKLYLVFETIIVLNFVALTFLHMSGIASYDRFLIYIDLMLLVYIGVMIGSTFSYYFVQKEKSHKSVMIGLIGLSVFSFFEIVVTILTAKLPFKIDIGGLFIIIGMIFLLFFAILDQTKIFALLREETQNALAATKAKSDFLANMSHEIRTPINAIIGMNEMIMRESNQESVVDYAKDVSSASENLLRIVNDILDFSKVESGEVEIINDNYDLGEIIYDVTMLVNMKAKSKGLKFNIFIDEDIPCKLYGDDKRVREIVTNILNNAVKYTDNGFVNLRINGTMKDDNVVELSIQVEDSGQGIRKEDIEKIFVGFARVNTKKNRNIEGTGLGLPITKRLVELMGGTITVESEFGKGAVFTVILPQQMVSDEKMGNYLLHRHASTDEQENGKKEIAFPNAKILVVDDTPINLKVISKLLDKKDASVTCALSGEEMLRLIQENEYDIILLDHMMPDMDGIETLRATKKLEQNKCINAPMIALTANAIVGAKEMYLEAGFDDYLSKPVKPDALYEMLAKHLPEDKVRHE